MENLLNFVGSHGAVEASLPTHLSRTPSRWLYNAEYCQVSTSSIYQFTQPLWKPEYFSCDTPYFSQLEHRSLWRETRRGWAVTPISNFISHLILWPQTKKIFDWESVWGHHGLNARLLLCVCVCIRVWVWCVCAHKSGLGWTYLHMHEWCTSVKECVGTKGC